VFERGEETAEQFHVWFEEFARQKIDPNSLQRAVADIFEPIAGMTEILDSIKSQGLRLVLLSNTNSAHIGFIRENFDVLSRFDHEVLSYEVGALKPEAAIFEAALGQIQCRPEECFYTDDIPEYVEQGRKHGLQGEVFESPEALREQLAQRRLIV
jgi:putative hydrolase of the HAD superfamily